MKSLLQDNYIEMYSTHNEGKSFVAERYANMQIHFRQMCISINYSL